MSPLARFIAASGLTNLGDGVALVAWAWAASLLTRDPLLVALVPVAQQAPWALLALIAGVVTDRMDRRRLILAMDLLRAAAFALVALALWWALPDTAPTFAGTAAPSLEAGPPADAISPSGAESVPPSADPSRPDDQAAPSSGVASLPAYLALLLGALLVGAAEVFRDNAAQTMLPAMVPHARLEAANGRLWAAELSGNALIGPPLGAALVAIALPLPFALNALAYGAAALVVLRIAGSFAPGRTSPRPWRTELAEGAGFLRARPLLVLLAVVTGLWNLFFQMASIALVLHAQEGLGLTAQAFGLVLGFRCEGKNLP